MLNIVRTMDIDDFEPWSGAVSTYERIERAGLLDALATELEILYDGEISETGLNDLLWFESDYCYELVGLRTEESILEEIQEYEDELAEISEEMDDLTAEYQDECIGLAEWERAEIWEDSYKDQMLELRSRKSDAEAEISSLKSQLSEL